MEHNPTIYKESTTKKCPQCAKEIQAEAKVCRFCRARFEISIQGYCSNCHEVVEVDSHDKCNRCGSEILDRHMESHLIEKTAPADSPVEEMLIFERTGARIGWRFVASINDQFFLSVIASLIFALILIFIPGMSTWLDSANPLASFSESRFRILIIVLLPLLWICYFAIQEGLFGTTLGKSVGVRPMRLKVIRTDGSHLRFWQAFLRALIGFFETNIIGAIIVSTTRLHQRLGDLAAGTIVVDKTKIHRVKFGRASVLFEFMDGELKEIVSITKGVILTRAKNRPLWMVLHCLTREGRPVKIRANLMPESNVFGHEARIQELRARLEQTFQLPIIERFEWWRLIFAMVILAGLILLWVISELMFQ